jgi:hypothetical protein
LIEEINDNSNDRNIYIKLCFCKNNVMVIRIPIVIEEELLYVINLNGIRYLGNDTALYYDLSPSVVGKLREKLTSALIVTIRMDGDVGKTIVSGC